MKKQLRIVLKCIKWALLGIFCPVILYLVIGLIFTIIPTNPSKLDCITDNQVYFSSSIIHVDLILPIEAIDNSLSNGLDIPTNTKYVGFGWGDKDFYLETRTWADLSVLTAFKSLAIRTPSAMHVSYFKNAGKEWKSKNICSQQSKIINNHILSGFEVNENGTYQFIENGYGKNDFFYEGVGPYTGAKTCNTWINQCMKKAKIKTASWTPFNFGILRYIKDDE